MQPTTTHANDITKARDDATAEERAAVVRFLRDRRSGNANERAAWDDLIGHIEKGHPIGEPAREVAQPRFPGLATLEAPTMNK